jgi:dUTP pyrophosphatase
VIQLPYTLLTPTAKPPVRSTPGAAALDLHADIPWPVHLPPGSATPVPTGVALAIPEGYCGLIVGRSGLGARGTAILGGCIDHDYRGEVKVILHTANPNGLCIGLGDRIAQLLILPVPAVELVACDDVSGLGETARGAGGFGSTGR